jgi:hypothetical protein
MLDAARGAAYRFPRMATAAAWPLPPPARPEPAWIIDERSDLLWLLGGVAASYAFIAAHVLLGLPAVLLWWLWIVALDGPHVFATLSRTYLDRQEWSTRGPLLLGSLLWFAAGPAAFGLSALAGSPVPFGAFLGLANLWAYWHVVRQHYGFLALYKKKNADLAPEDNRVDSALLYGGLLLPFLAFILTHAEARRVLGLKAQLTWEPVAASACWIVVALLVAVALARQAARSLGGRPANRPKLLFLAAALPLSWIVFSPWVASRSDFAMFAVFVTAFHNIQYHAIVWFYHRNRYRGTGADTRAFGLAPRISSRFWIYAAAGIAFTLAYRLAGCGLGTAPGCGGFSLTAPLAAGLTASHLAQGFFWGFALHHYYLDQKIWRLRKDSRLNRDLGLATA